MATVRQNQLKSCQRVTFSLPKEVAAELTTLVPKSKRSAFVVRWLKIGIRQEKEVVQEKEDFFSSWKRFREENPPKETGKTIVEMIREDRQSH